MKKILTILIALSLAGTVTAQATVPTGGTGTTTLPTQQILYGSTTQRISSSPLFKFNELLNLLTVTNATTTNLTALKFWLIGTSDGCATFSSGQLISTGSACGSGSGGSSNWTRINNSGIYPATSTDQVIIGSTSTSSLSKLQVTGGATIDNGTTTNATSTNLFATTASTTQIYTAQGISIGTSSQPAKSIIIQKDDGSSFLIAARGTASGRIDMNFTNALPTIITNGGFLVLGDNTVGGNSKASQLLTTHQNTADGQVCLLRQTSTAGSNSTIIGGGSSVCKANEFFYVFNSNGAGSSTPTGVQAFQINPTGDAIFGPNAPQPGFKLTVSGDALVYGSTTMNRVVATSTTVFSSLPLLTSTDNITTRATTTNATSTNAFITNISSTVSSTTNAFVNNGIAVGTTTNPFRSITIQKEDGTTAYQMSRGTVNYTESVFAGIPTFTSNGGSFVYGSDLTDSADKLTRLRFWGYNTASGVPNCGFSNDSRAASNLLLFGGISVGCYGPTEYRFYNSTSTNSTYQESTFTLNSTGVVIGKSSPSEKLSVEGSTTVASRVTASAFTATSSTATSSIPRIENTVFYMNNDLITDFTGSGLSVVGGALTVTSSGSASSTLYSDNGNWSGNNKFSGGVALTNLTQGWVYTDGGTNNLNSSTSPTVNYVTATSTTATSTLPKVEHSFIKLGTDTINDFTGTGIINVGGALTLDTSSLWATTSANWNFAVNLSATTTLPNLTTLTGLTDTITTRSTTTNATTTNLFSSTASSSNLFSRNVIVGSTSPISIDQLVSTGDLDTYALTLSNNDNATFNAWRISPTGSQWSAGDNKLVIVPPGNTLSSKALVTIDATTLNFGIGTTSPYAKLSVTGPVVGETFTATSTTATSTFPKVETTYLKVDGDTVNDLTGSGLSVVGGALTVTGTGSSTLLSDSNTFSGALNKFLNSVSVASSTPDPLNRFTVSGMSQIDGMLVVGSTSPFTTRPNEIAHFVKSIDGYAGTAFINRSPGTTASVDLLLNNDATDDAGTVHFADIGMNGSANVDPNYTGLGGGSALYDYAATGNRVTAIASTSATSYIGWLTGGLLSSNEKMRLTNGGSLGIGTTSPYALLSVAGQIAGNNFYAASTTATSTFAGGALFNGNIGVGSSTPNGKFVIRNIDAGPSFIVEDQAADLSPFIIDTTGRVGIGTTSTAVPKLSIQGNGTTVNANLQLYDSNGVPTFSVLDNGSVNFGSSTATLVNFIDPAVSANGTARTLRFRNTTTSQPEGFQFWNGNTNTNLMMIQQNGNVGIGSTTPFGRFSIQGKAGSTTDVFVVASSSNANYMTIKSSGETGFGSSTPFGTFSINAASQSVGQPTFVVGSSTKTDFTVQQSGKASFGTSTVSTNSNLTVNDAAATTTVFIRSGSTVLGGRLVIEDVSGTTCTELTTNAGVVSSKVVSCP